MFNVNKWQYFVNKLYTFFRVPIYLSTFRPIRYRRIFGHFAAWLDCPKSVLSNAHIDYSSLFHLLPSQTRLAEVASLACVERSNVLAKQSRKLTCVYLGLRVAKRYVHLRWLAMTFAHFGRDQICTKVNASFLPFGHPTQVNASWYFHSLIISQLKTG